MTVSICWYLVPSSCIQMFIWLPFFLSLSLISLPLSVCPSKEKEMKKLATWFIIISRKLKISGICITCIWTIFINRKTPKQANKCCTKTAVFLCGDYFRTVVLQLLKLFGVVLGHEIIKMLKMKLTVEMKIKCCLNSDDDLILLHRGQ